LRINLQEEDIKIKHSATVVSPEGRRDRKPLKLSTKEELGSNLRQTQASPLRIQKVMVEEPSPIRALNLNRQDSDQLSLFSPLKKTSSPVRGGGHIRHSSTTTQIRHSRNGSDTKGLPGQRTRHIQSLEASFSKERESSYTRDLSPFKENRPSYDEKMLSPLSKTEKTESDKNTIPIILQKSFKMSRATSDGNLVFPEGFCSPLRAGGEELNLTIETKVEESPVTHKPAIFNGELKHKIEKNY